MEERIETPIETKRFEQLGILVLDGSGSMSEEGMTGQPKAHEVNIAVRDLIVRLQASKKSDNFILSIVTYDHRVNRDFIRPTPVKDLDPLAVYNPLNGHGGETAIGDALEQAASVADEFFAGQSSFPRTAVIMLMTDGQNNRGKDPEEVAKNIKSQFDQGKCEICAVGYGKGDSVDTIMLQKIVSNIERGYLQVYNAEKLRDFFVASMTR